MRDRNGNRTWSKYDLTGRLTHTYVPDATPLVTDDGPVRETIYDLIGRVQFEIDVHDDDVATLHAYDYKLTVSGHRHQVIEGAKTTTYDYDDLYRLTGEAIAGSGTGGSPVGSIAYTLDKVGNRRHRSPRSPTATPTTPSGS